ncbi:hypothetical protein MBANPS3_009699 [Mucor bainieri]
MSNIKNTLPSLQEGQNQEVVSVSDLPPPPSYNLDEERDSFTAFEDDKRLRTICSDSDRHQNGNGPQDPVPSQSPAVYKEEEFYESKPYSRQRRVCCLSLFWFAVICDICATVVALLGTMGATLKCRAQCADNCDDICNPKSEKGLIASLVIFVILSSAILLSLIGSSTTIMSTPSSHLNTHADEPQQVVISHNPFIAQSSSAPLPLPLLPQQQGEKHIIYFDDYGVSPPSYDVAQESNHHNSTLDETTIHTSDADYHISEDIPLHTYSEDTSSSVSDTAPLMMDESHQQPLTSNYTPSAPPLDQVEDHSFEYMDDKTPKKKRKITLARLFIACCVWFAGISFMSVSIFAYECFDKCQTDEDCNGCTLGVRKGGIALAYTYFILGCVFTTYKAVRFILSA